jgi:hypothetical protein
MGHFYLKRPAVQSNSGALDLNEAGSTFSACRAQGTAPNLSAISPFLKNSIHAKILREKQAPNACISCTNVLKFVTLDHHGLGVLEEYPPHMGVSVIGVAQSIGYVIPFWVMEAGDSDSVVMKWSRDALPVLPK